MATAAPALKALGKLAQSLPLGEGEGSQGGPPVDAAANQPNISPPPPPNLPPPPDPVATTLQQSGAAANVGGSAPLGTDAAPTNQPFNPTSIGAVPAVIDAVLAGDSPAPAQPRKNGSEPQKKFDPTSIGAIPLPSSPKEQLPASKQFKPEDIGAIPAASTDQSRPATFTPPEVTQPQQSEAPPATYPTIAQDQPDTHEQISQLVQQGLSPGQAQSVVKGQIPKSISGDTPPPPKLPVQQEPTQPAPQTTVVIPPPPVAGEAKSPAPVATLKADEKNRVDPVQLYSYLLGKFAHSPLVNYVPPDGARWGIKTGSAAEWAAFGLAVAKQESDLNTRSYNDADPGGSAGLFQFGQGQTQFTKGSDQFDPQASADAFVRSVEHFLANKGNVANMGETFGSIRRPNEAGQYIAGAQKVAAGGSGKDLVSSGKGDEGSGPPVAPGQDRNAPVPQPEWSFPSIGGGGATPRSPQTETPSFGGGGDRDAGQAPRPGPESSFYLPVGGGGSGGGRGGGDDQQQQPPKQRTQVSAPPDEEPDPMVAALMKRGFTQQQALQYAQGVQNIAPGKGLGPIQKGLPPAAPSSVTPIKLSLTSKQPVTPQLLSAKQLMSGKVTKAAPPAAPSVTAKAPLQLNAPPPAPSAAQPLPPLRAPLSPIPKRPGAPAQPPQPAQPAQQPQQAPLPPQKPASDMPPAKRQVEADSVSMRPLGYKAAVQLPSGEVHTGNDHDHAYHEAGSPREQPGLQFGFADKKGQFVTMDEADKILEKHKAGGSPPAAPGPAITEQETAKPKPKPKVQAEPTEFTGRPAGSTHGDPNPPGMEALTGTLKDHGKQHKALLSSDDPRVSKQSDNLIKGEHFVEGDPYHEQLLGGLPYGKQGPQRQKLAQGETAIADKTPLHISYISSPKELEKFPTRESRRIQYDKSSPEARLMDATEGALVGHSMIPLNVGVKLPSKKEEKAGNATHQSYIQGISTNVMANNFQHINDKLAAMGRKTPYPKLGTKFANDLEGYYHNLLSGHTATGSGYAVGTEDHPNTPDRGHVPYMLTRKEADFIGAVINNTAAFAKHEDGQKIRELARANGTLITEKGETNRLLHDIEQADPGWSGRGTTGKGRVLEPSIKTFKTGLIHEIHPTEQHLPDTIRPGKEYQQLTKALARTSERGRPDIAIGASLHHTFQDNKKINQIERDFSDHKIDEAEARNRIKALGEDPDDYRFVGGSGGLITPYEDDPEALTPEEHTQMKDNLRQAWVGGKMNVEDYRKKSAEVPLPSKPSKLTSPASQQSQSKPVEAPEAPPAPKPLAPKPPRPPKPKAPPSPEPEDIEAPEPETPETPAPAPKPQPKPKAPAVPPAPDEPLPEEKPEEEEPKEPAKPKAPPAPKKPSRAVDETGKPLTMLHGTGATIKDFDPRKTAAGMHWFTSDPQAADVYASRSAKEMMEGGEETTKKITEHHLHAENPLDAGQPVNKQFLNDFYKHWSEERAERGVKPLDKNWINQKIKDVHVTAKSNTEKGLDNSIFHARGTMVGGEHSRLATVLKRMGYDSIKYHGKDPIKDAFTGDVYKEPYDQWGVFGPEQIRSAKEGEEPPVATEAEEPKVAQPPAPDEPLPKVKADKPARVSPPVAKTAKLEKLVKPKDANKEWKGVPEAEKQKYLEEKVRRTLASQIRDKATHELKVQRNEDGSVKYDPNGSPVYEQHDYDIANSPMLKKKALDQIKDADKHEDTIGNLIGPDGKEVIDPETGKPVLKHKTLNQTERRRLSAMHSASAVHTMGDKIFDSYMSVKDHPQIAAGEGWYSRMRKKLADALGEHHELFAQLLGATSAKTPVRTNFINALDAFEQYKEGKFKNHIEKFLEAHGKLQEGEGALTQHMRDTGILKAHEADHESDADAMAHWIRHHKILPHSKIGNKYSANSNAVLKVLAGTWLKEVGAPKTPNFAGNLTGRTLEATIDVWAARHLQRLGYEGHMKGPWRAQSAAEPAVSNMDFAFSQDAMRHAADRISRETGKNMNPDDLQAILWFAEKHHYEERGWTRGQGAEKSSFDDVADRVFGKDGQPHDRPMDSTQLRAHYAAEAKALNQRKGKIKTAQGYLGTPHEQTKLPGYMQQHGLTHEEVHGGTQDEDEEAA